MDLTQYSRERWFENEEILMNELKNLSWDTFPLLNHVDSDKLKDGQLVRFIGMVQDMYNPEYYVESFVCINKETKEQTIKSGKYVDFIKCEENLSFDLNNPDTVRKELQTYYVISVPGENDWVRRINEKRQETLSEQLKTNVSHQKRKIDTESPMEIESSSNSEASSSIAHDSNKRPCCVPERNHPSNGKVLSTEYLLNFPLNDEKGKACQVKVYNNEDKIKLNDICEFVGFLSINPSLCQEYDSSTDNDQQIEKQVHNPPPSLIPRIHCLTFKKLKHSNPLVESLDLDSKKLETIRREIILVLTQLLLGDEIAAEYLLCHLISEVYVRTDMLALGKFSLNLSHIPEGIDFVEKLYQFIQLMMPKSHYLALTLDNLNTLSFIPKKDYESDRLNSGVLQLSANTVVVLDETKLEAGELGPSGVKAVQAISNVIRTQKISYDFNYYPVEFECDISFLTCSIGKSLLPSDYHIVLQPDPGHIETFNEIVEAAKIFLKPELLDDIRKYFTLCRLISYNIDDNVHELIQNQFVAMRQSGATGNDLHNVLVLNRLICLSYGKNCLDGLSWEMATKLEDKRKSRLS